MTVLTEANWQLIDEDAKKYPKVFVRNGNTYAKVRWSQVYGWVYYTTTVDDPIDFTPREYSVL